MSDGTEVLPEVKWPSVDESSPTEEGGPTARTGFTYQDEIAVSFLIEMLKTPSILKIHCETHDDILIVHVQGEVRIAEFVQVKGEMPDRLWSVPKLCERAGSKSGKPTKSIFEVSLGKDRYAEFSRFRIVTLRPVVKALKVLTYPIGTPGREPACEAMTALIKDIDARCPGAKSLKNNGSQFWCENCLWDERESREAIEKLNELALLKLCFAEGRNLLPEQVAVLLEDLRAWAKKAAEAKWSPDPSIKIITREQLCKWWNGRIEEIRSGASSSAGGKLRGKMQDASISEEVIDLAVDMRRDYSAAVRTSRYMDEHQAGKLQERVKSELITLRTRYAAGLIDMDGPTFHALCLGRMDQINTERPQGTDDQSAFLKGCMYDIADRCLHRFARSGS